MKIEEDVYRLSALFKIAKHIFVFVFSSLRLRYHLTFSISVPLQGKLPIRFLDISIRIDGAFLVFFLSLVAIDVIE